MEASHGQEAGSTRDSLSAVFSGLALVAGLAELVYRPFLLCPIGFAILIIGAPMSPKYRRLSVASAFVLTAGFVIGGAFAVWDSRPLY